MKIKLPQIIYFLDYKNKHLLLRFRLVTLNQSLFLETMLSQLLMNPHNQNIKESFYNNPSDEALYDRVEQRILNSVIIGYNELISFNKYLESLIIKDDFTELNIALRDTRATIHLESYQVYGLQNFIQDLTKNFIGYQVSLIEVVTKYKIEEPEVKVEPIEDIQDLIVENPPIEITELTVTDNFIQDLLQLSPNNLTTFYISKYIHNGLVLKHHTIVIPNFFFYTDQNRQDLAQIIKSITLTPSEITSRIYSLYKNLYNIVIINPSLFNDNKQNVYVILFLLYLYWIKCTPQLELKTLSGQMDLKDTFIKSMPIIMNLLTPKENITILFEEDPGSLVNPIVNSDEVLDQIIRKYKYLININKQSFIDNVFDELSNLNNPIETPKSNFLLTTPSILDIEFLMSQKGNTKLTDDTDFFPYIQYEPTIITSSYSLIQSLNSGVIPKTPTPVIISKYFKIIIDKIFYSIDQSHQMLSMEPVSTQLLMDKYIITYIDHKESNFVKLFLLFQITIPYLYDKYKIKNFLNFFI